jgi:hypothetical protein
LSAKGVQLYRQESDAVQTLLVGEGHLLELMASDASLPHVLGRICNALDVQVGNVVSLVLFSDDNEHFAHTIAQSAALCGLSVFSCTAILSLSGDLLGTFEVYCCFQRSPTSSESNLIEQATHLAALAIQCHNHEQDSKSFPFHRRAQRGEPFARDPVQN